MQSEMIEELPLHATIADHRDELAPCSAVRAREHVDSESPLARDGAALPLVFRGATGDQVFLMASPAPALLPDLPWNGASLLHRRVRIRVFQGVIPAGGVLNASWALPDTIAPALEVASVHLQAIVLSSQRQVVLTDARALVVLDHVS